MNDVALEIIKTIGDELSLLREEMKMAKKLLEQQHEEIEQLRDDNYWYKEWSKLHDKCIAADVIEKVEAITEPLPF